MLFSSCLSLPKPHLSLGWVCSQMKERRFPFGFMLSSYPYCFGIERNQLENCKKPDNAAIFCCPVLILLHKWLWRDSWILILPSALVLHVTHTQLPSMGSCSPLLLQQGEKISYNLGSSASNKKKSRDLGNHPWSWLTVSDQEEQLCLLNFSPLIVSCEILFPLKSKPVIKTGPSCTFLPVLLFKIAPTLWNRHSQKPNSRR